MQVGYKAHYAYGDAERNSQRQTDNHESDAEEDTDAEAYQGLPAEVAVHAFTQIAQQAGDKSALLVWYGLDEAVVQFLVIHQDEKEIDPMMVSMMLAVW